MVELDTEGEMTRSEVAVFLREFADELDAATAGTPRDDTFDGNRTERPEEFTDEGSFDPERITIIVGGDSATVTVPNTVTFDVEVESRAPMFGSGVNQEIEFELSWEIENPDELGEDWIEVE